MKIRMIGFDLDGTLLTDNKALTPHTREILEKLVEKNIKIIISTGRPLSGVPKELIQLPGIRYAITANGARVYDYQQERTVFEELLAVETAEKVFGIFRDYDTLQEVYYDGIGYAEKVQIEQAERYVPDPGLVTYLKETRRTIDETVQELFERKNQPVDKAHAFFRDYAQKREAVMRLSRVDGITYTESFAADIEVSAQGVDKARALLELGASMGINAEEIMAFGDGLNDLSMIQRVGCGVCMENGHETLKKAADYVTGTNEEEGVVQAIQKLVFGENT